MIIFTASGIRQRCGLNPAILPEFVTRAQKHAHNPELPHPIGESSVQSSLVADHCEKHHNPAQHQFTPISQIGAVWGLTNPSSTPIRDSDHKILSEGTKWYALIQ